MSYNYKRTTAKVRQLDGTYARKGFYAKSDKELKAKIKKAQNEAEQAYELSRYPYFNSVLDEWYDRHQEDIALNTRLSYQAPMKEIKAEFEGLRMSEITLKDMQNILDRMKLQGYARQTIDLRRIVLSSVCQYAVMQGYIDNSPALYLKTPRNAPHKTRELPTDEEIETIKNAKGEMAELARFLLYTGCRIGEALALTSGDVQDGYITINKTIVHNVNTPIVKPSPKTNAGIRKIPILKPVETILQNRKGIIFPNPKGDYYKRYEIYYYWKKFKEEYNLNVSPHQLRHGFATICYDANLDTKEAQELLGHSSVKITQDVYTHITEQRRKISAEKLNDFVGKI